MSVYVIASGSAEEYEVIGVTKDKKQAKRWQRNGALVSEHHMDDLPVLPDGYFFYDVELYRSDDKKPLAYQTVENLSYGGEHLTYKDRYVVYAVLARDAEEAVREAMRRVAG